MTLDPVHDDPDLAQSAPSPCCATASKLNQKYVSGSELIDPLMLCF